MGRARRMHRAHQVSIVHPRWAQLEKGQQIIVRDENGVLYQGTLVGKHPVPYLEIVYMTRDGQRHRVPSTHVEEILAQSSG